MKREYVEVQYHQKENAKKCGAKWDSNKQTWYVDECKKELFLLQFMRLTKTQRKCYYIGKEIDDCFRRISHNNNADITIYNPEIDKDCKESIDMLQKKLDKYQKKALDEKNNNHDLNYYIKKEEEKLKKSQGDTHKSVYF